MNKKLIVGVIVVVALGIAGGAVWYAMSQKAEDAPAAGLESSANAANDNTPAASPIATGGDLSTDSAVAKLENAGMTVGADQGIFFEMVNADSGVKVPVSDVMVEIYSYNSSSAQAEGLKLLQETKASVDEAQAAGQTMGVDMSSEIFEHDNLLVVVHSADQAFIDKVKQAIKS